MELKEGYKQSEVGVIPQDWDVSQLTSVIDSMPQNGVFNEPARKGRGFKLINVINLYSSFPLEIDGLELFEATKDELSRFEVELGDVFFTRSSLTVEGIAHCNMHGRNCTDKILFDCHLIRVRPNQKRIEPAFLARYCTSYAARRYLVANAKTTTMTTVDQSVIAKMPIPIPRALEEQRAIATTLSDVDALLSGLDRLTAKKRDLKQAAMQQLLTGQTRLPGFSGDWEVKRLGDVLRFQVGFPFSSVYFNEKEQGLRLVKNRDLKSDDQAIYYVGKYDEAFLVADGDVLVGMDGDFLACRWIKGRALLNQRVGRVVARSGLDRIFAYYFLIEPLKDIEATTSSTTVKHLSHGDVEGIEKPMPKVDEQTAIAAVLSDMDAEIEALEARRAKTRDLKQAMMQELLTGKTRLVPPAAA